MPWTFGAFAVASLSMIGIPPVSGFVTKWFLVNGAVQIHQVVLLVCLLASTLLNAAYFGPVVYKAFFGKPVQAELAFDYEQVREAPLCMVIPLCITAALSVLIGIYPDPVIQLIQIFRGV
jgi:multicomponent Na+:H+ antiporter subunit D